MNPGLKCHESCAKSCRTRYSGSHGLAVFLPALTFQKNYQVVSEVDRVVGNLLQAARCKDKVEVRLILGVFVCTPATQNVVAISIHRCSAFSGVACQHGIKTGK